MNNEAGKDIVKPHIKDKKYIYIFLSFIILIILIVYIYIQTIKITELIEKNNSINDELLNNKTFISLKEETTKKRADLLKEETEYELLGEKIEEDKAMLSCLKAQFQRIANGEEADKGFCEKNF